MKKPRLRLPSPAMVVAAVALFSSLGGVSYGLATGSVNGREVKNRSLTGKDVKRNSIGGAAVKERSLGAVPQAGFASQAAGVTHFARISAGGNIGLSRGALSAVPSAPGPGDYRVVFNRDISTCAYFATITTDAPVANALRGQIAVGLSNADARALQVQTTNAEGAPANRPFHVAVLC
jgi:hypothetical protein